MADAYLNRLRALAAQEKQRAAHLRDAAAILHKHQPSVLTSVDDYRSGWAGAVSALSAIVQTAQDAANGHQASADAYQRGLNSGGDRG